jgi:hypothetical protein
MGRPTKLDAVLRQTGSGPVTVADEIIERVRGGAARADAAASVGIARSTLQEWVRDGARLAARRLAGDELTDDEHALADFSDREAEAVAEWKVEQELQLSLLSTARSREVVTEKRDSAGNLLERTTRTEGIEPDARVIQWRLERRFPDQYGRQRLELSGPDGGPVPLDLRSAALDRLLQMAEQLQQNTVEHEHDGEQSDEQQS